jgi:bacterial/archaeal transporter family protein
MTDNTRWIAYALLGAFFAAVVQITSKFAFKKNPDLDTATVNLIRAFVMSGFFAIVISYEVLVAQTRQWLGATDRSAKVAIAWVLGSGIAASLSWYYGYKALKLTGVAKSYPIDKLSVVMGVLLAVLLLSERPNGWNWTGIVLMVAGAMLVTIPQDKSPLWLLGK